VLRYLDARDRKRVWRGAAEALTDRGPVPRVPTTPSPALPVLRRCLVVPPAGRRPIPAAFTLSHEHQRTREELRAARLSLLRCRPKRRADQSTARAAHHPLALSNGRTRLTNGADAVARRADRGMGSGRGVALSSAPQAAPAATGHDPRDLLAGTAW